jgi:hypothetical protein
LYTCPFSWQEPAGFEAPSGRAGFVGLSPIAFRLSVSDQICQAGLVAPTTFIAKLFGLEMTIPLELLGHSIMLASQWDMQRFGSRVICPVPHPFFEPLPFGAAGRLLGRRHSSICRRVSCGQLPSVKLPMCAEMIPIAETEFACLSCGRRCPIIYGGAHFHCGCAPVDEAFALAREYPPEELRIVQEGFFKEDRVAA